MTEKSAYIFLDINSSPAEGHAVSVDDAVRTLLDFADTYDIEWVQHITIINGVPDIEDMSDIIFPKAVRDVVDGFEFDHIPTYKGRLQADLEEYKRTHPQTRRENAIEDKITQMQEVA